MSEKLDIEINEYIQNKYFYLSDELIKNIKNEKKKRN